MANGLRWGLAVPMKVSSDAGAFHLVNGRSVRESAPLNRRDKWRDNNLMRPDFESQRLPLIRIAHRRMATGEDDHNEDQKAFDEALLASVCVASDDPRG
jgi:hypothetical protein